MVLSALEKQTIKPKEVVIICDGWSELGVTSIPKINLPHSIIQLEKHKPGMEQPRNIGVRHLKQSNHVWFIDSDVVPLKDCLEQYYYAFETQPAYDRVLIGPYDWLSKGQRNLGEINLEQAKNDPRWDLFNKYGPASVFFGKLNVALACFSGNLVWPIREFKRVGGFWNEIHMGRCEDGELGIRAAAMGVPMSVVMGARAFHLWHEVNTQAILEKNKRDVPMINKRHPYVEDQGMIVVDYDGKRFDYICDCGEQINTLNIWSHKCPTPTQMNTGSLS